MKQILYNPAKEQEQVTLETNFPLILDLSLYSEFSTNQCTEYKQATLKCYAQKLQRSGTLICLELPLQQAERNSLPYSPRLEIVLHDELP